MRAPNLRGWAAVTLFLFLILGCSSGEGNGEGRTSLQGVNGSGPIDVSGTWRWKLQRELGCPVFPGWLEGTDVEFINVFQDGGLLDGFTTDSAGNSVVLDGSVTLDGEMVVINATITISEPNFADQKDGIEICDGKIYVVNQPQGVINVISGADVSTLSTINLGAGIGRPCPTPDHNFLIVPMTFNNTVQVIDTSTDTVVRTLTENLSFPTTCAVNHAGTRLYIGNDDKKSYVAEYDVATWSYLRGQLVGGFGMSDMVLTHDDQWLFTMMHDSSSFNVLRTSDLSLDQANVPAPSRVKSAAVTMNDDDLWMIGEGGLQKYPLQFATAPNVFTELAGCDIKATPDGLGLYFTRFAPISMLSGKEVRFPFASCFDLNREEVVQDFFSPVEHFGGFGLDCCEFQDDKFGTFNIGIVGMGSSVPIHGFFPGGGFGKGGDVGVADGFFGDWVYILDRTVLPRRIVITLNGTGAYNDIDRMVDGNFQISFDSSPFANQCVGLQHLFWFAVGDFDR